VDVLESVTMDALDPPLADADIAPMAQLLADTARAAMLWSLSDGRALPAGALAAAGRVQPSTASEHLAKLVQGGLLVAERHGRHRYYRLANDRIVPALEALAVAARPTVARSSKEAHTARQLRFARSCYDHLAGAVGVRLTDALVGADALRLVGRDYQLTAAGADRLRGLGLDVEGMAEMARRRRRALARACLDWSERRYHIAGVLGAALLTRLLELRWFERVPAGRALRPTPIGRRGFRREFGLVVDVGLG
jgi:DNA-binding transcriptional ArsR family regulator